MIILPSDCYFGMRTSSFYTQEGFTYVARHSYTTTNSADTELDGSICPRRTGLYTLSSKGTETIYMCVFKFEEVEYPIVTTLERYLYEGRCYPFYLNSRGIKSTSVELWIRYENEPEHLLNNTESITCQYDNINGVYIKNNMWI